MIHPSNIDRFCKLRLSLLQHFRITPRRFHECHRAQSDDRNGEPGDRNDALSPADFEGAPIGRFRVSSSSLARVSDGSEPARCIHGSRLACLVRCMSFHAHRSTRRLCRVSCDEFSWECRWVLTAVAIIYSPWGKQSGAHINPSVTLTFLRLGKIQGWDAALLYSVAICGRSVGRSSGGPVLLGRAGLGPGRSLRGHDTWTPWTVGSVARGIRHRNQY